jgi:hypothetical protein
MSGLRDYTGSSNSNSRTFLCLDEILIRQYCRLVRVYIVIVVRHGIWPRILLLKVQRCWLVQVWTVILFFRSEGSISISIRSNNRMRFLSSVGRAGFWVGIPLVGNRKQDCKLKLLIFQVFIQSAGRFGFCFVVPSKLFSKNNSIEAFLQEQYRIRFKKFIRIPLILRDFFVNHSTKNQFNSTGNSKQVHHVIKKIEILKLKNGGYL